MNDKKIKIQYFSFHYSNTQINFKQGVMQLSLFFTNATLAIFCQ